VTDACARERNPPLPHWGDAAFHWHHYGPPLRPSPADVRAMEELVRHAYGERRPPGVNALLLGVTPEIAAMAWPAGTRLLAVDKSRPMIERVWPGDVALERNALCADWFEFAGGADRFDVVIGDGVFAPLDYPRQYRALAARARDWMARDGLLVARLFQQPARQETPAAVFADLLANRIASFHSFKLRLAMALQTSAEAGVRMGDAFDAWKNARVDRGALGAMTGWTPEVIETIRPWEGKDSRLSFPNAGEMERVMSEHFDRQDERRLPVELGERCPVVSYRPRG